MNETGAVSKAMQDEILNTVRKSQAAVVEAIQSWASAVQSITPGVNVPSAAKLPEPADLVASAYDFAEQLLASQRKFAEDVLQATAPLVPSKEVSSAQRS